MGVKQTANFDKRFKNGFKIIYSDKPLEGDSRRLQNQKILEAVTAVLRGILKREPTPDELSGCRQISKRKLI
ncbi:MAG: hypothetical protein Q7K71_05490 [Candidatus Omnitrophota bacterium]|nr:hypothetical protein [Candidatus Omnitrophota bacterium]